MTDSDPEVSDAGATPRRGVRAVFPAGGPVDGEVRLPGSKSLTNRALVLASLAEGETRIERPLISDDTLFMVAGLKNLGFQVRKKEQHDFITVQGAGGAVPWNEGRVWAGSAGTVLRFLLALLPLGRGRFLLDGDEHLRRRPILDLVEALRALGAEITPLGGDGDRLPLEIEGRGGLEGGEVELDGVTSSQFLSALLLSGRRYRRGVAVTVRGDLVSKPYADLTVQALEAFGVPVERDGYARFAVRPGPMACPRFAVEGDASAATYFLGAAAVCGGRVRVHGVGEGSLQGDAAFASVLRAMGCEETSGRDWIEVRGPVVRGGTFDLNAMPDAALTLAVVAPFAGTPTRIVNVANLRLKESDRIAALVAELRRTGIHAVELADGLEIRPGRPHGALVRTYEDHRVAMAFAVLGLAVEGISLENPGCVSKSFPDFFERLDALTGRPRP